MKVCVVGLGYIGLPTATLAAMAGHKVIGAEINPAIVRAINSGKPHIKEPGLSELVRDVVASGHLFAQQEVCNADVFIVAVPTPITSEKNADLECVRNATEEVSRHIARGSLFIVESTIPPGCTEELCIPILEKSGLTAGVDFYVAHCPERVIPGNVMYELVHNDRVIGGLNEESKIRAKRFYSTFVEGEIFTTGIKEAELTKLAENAYRDVNIAFANELALICEKLNIDAWDVIKLANRHPRVNILNPGPGVGGHCIAVDPWFLVEKCPEETRLISTARKVNDDRPAQIVKKLEKELLEHGIDDPVIACLGLTYKADVCDMRCSPALDVVSILEKKGYNLRLCDPYANGDCPYECVSVEEALENADAAILLVDHQEFVNLDLNYVKELMRNEIIIDTKGVWLDSNNKQAKPEIRLSYQKIAG